MTRPGEPTWVVDAGPLIGQGRRESFSWTALLAALVTSGDGTIAVPAPALQEALLAVDTDDWYLIDQTTMRGEFAAAVTVEDFAALDIHETARLMLNSGCSPGTAHAALLARRFDAAVLTGDVDTMRGLLGADWLIYQG